MSFLLFQKYASLTHIYLLLPGIPCFALNYWNYEVSVRVLLDFLLSRNWRVVVWFEEVDLENNVEDYFP